MQKLTLCLLFVLLGINVNYSQSLKEKLAAKKEKLAAKMKKDHKPEIYECGYVHKPTMKEKMSIMKLIQKGMGNALTDGSNKDLSKVAGTICYQRHLYPQSIMRFPTKTEGWETCGDAILAGFTNKSGIGLSSPGDMYFSHNGQDNLVKLETAGMGSYFQGFSPGNVGVKSFGLGADPNNLVKGDIKPAAPLEIISIDGVPRGQVVEIDGTKDIVIELKDGDADLNSRLQVQMLCKLMGTPVIFDVLVTKAKNIIVVPKEAFFNFEGSPTPFADINTLIVNRVTTEIVDGTAMGAMQVLSCYMDWSPATVVGKLAKGSIVTAGFDEEKNTKIDVNLSSEGEYQFNVSKAGPYTSPPVKMMKKVAIISFVVKGNLSAKNVTSSKYSITTTTKYFPELKKDTWQKLANKMHDEFQTNFATQMGVEVVPLESVLRSAAYKHVKPIRDTVSNSFVEVGAYGTERILTTSTKDVFKDMSITFPGDMASQRLVRELGVDAVIAVTFDLDFDFESEGLMPKVNIVAFAPNVSYKTAAQYFSIKGSTTAKSLNDSRKYTGGVENVLYQMIKADAFNKNLTEALKELSIKEDENPVYEKLWKAKM